MGVLLAQPLAGVGLGLPVILRTKSVVDEVAGPEAPSARSPTAPRAELRRAPVVVRPDRGIVGK